MLFTVIFLISSVFQIYVYFLWMQCFLKKTRVAKSMVIFAYMVMFIMMTAPYLLFNVPIVTLSFSYAACLLITLVYNGKWKQKILTGTFLMGMMAMTECVIAVFSGYMKLEVFQSNEYYSIFGTVCLPIFQFMIVLIVRNFKNMKYGEDVSIFYWAMSIALPLLSIFMLLLFYKQPYINAGDMLCIIVILLVINIFVFSLYDKQIQSYKIKQEKESLQMQNKYQLNQLKLMHETVEKSRSLKHDFLKHISMIDYCLKEGNKEQLSDYLKEIHSNIDVKYRYVDTGNFVFDSILNYKIQETMEEGIKINVEAKIPDDLEISAYDINIILSNLLDNSIEAVSKTEDKNIDINIIYSKNRLKIIIINSCRSILNKINGEYETTKLDGENHGYGLKNVKAVVDKYDGVMNIENENDKFKVFICIFM